MVVMSSPQGLPVLALQEGPAAGREPNPICSPSALVTASLLCNRTWGFQNSSSAPPRAPPPPAFRAGSAHSPAPPYPLRWSSAT